jgi:hypothetical protein
MFQQTLTIDSPTASTTTSMKARYDFPAELEGAYDMRGNAVPHVRLVVRKDTDDVLAAVSDRYRLITHKEVMQPVEDFVRTVGKPSDERYVIEKNGARLVATHTFKDVALTLPGHRYHGASRSLGDVVALRTHAINSYNSTTAFEFRLGSLVLRCLNGATSEESLFGLRFKHIQSADIQFPSAAVLLKAFEKQGDIWKSWAEQGLTPTVKADVITKGKHLQLVTDRHLKDAAPYFDYSETVWDLFNAFTYVITHNGRVQESGKLNRYDRLNGLFNHVFANPVLVQ